MARAGRQDDICDTADGVVNSLQTGRGPRATMRMRILRTLACVQPISMPCIGEHMFD